MRKLSLNKKALTLLVTVMAILPVVAAPTALAWKEGPSANWWFVGASITDAYFEDADLVIEINGDPSDGQTFNVGDAITITCDLHSYAIASTQWSNGAWADWSLEVDGPAGYDSDDGWLWEWSNSSHADVEADTTLTIAYLLTAPGTHTIDMNAYAEVAAWDWHGNEYLYEDESAAASLTFEVVMPVVIIDGCDTGVTDQVVNDSSISEKIAECAVDARNHGEFVRCVAHLTNEWKGAGYITGKQKGAIQSCAARAG